MKLPRAAQLKPGEATQDGWLLARLRNPRYLAAWQKWVGAARRFRGLGPHMQAERELRNIRLHNSGYQVVIGRGKRYHTRCFSGGFTDDVLQKAKAYRDAWLAKSPRPRLQLIPQEVLDELGLSEPVIGVTLCAQRSCFRTAVPGRKPMRIFYYRYVSQADAYAAAIQAREEELAQKHATT